MEIQDTNKAKTYLQNIGYYRLSAYWLPFEQPSTTTPKIHRFLPHTQFDKVLELYVFDRKLRILIMEALERIEISVRSLWAHHLSAIYGSHPHLDERNFTNQMDFTKDLEKLQVEVDRSRETFIIHYQKTYSTPPLPPIWAVVEVMSLGSLSRWICNTNDNAILKKIASSLDLPNVKLLKSTLHILTPIRNTCAHHGRLWNKRFPMQPVIPNKISTRFVNEPTLKHHIFNYLVLLESLVSALSPKSTWKARLMDLINYRSDAELLAMGFPEDYRNRLPWSSSAIDHLSQSSSISN